MGHNGYAHKVASFVLRGLELISSIIILGLLGRFFHLLDVFDAPANSRLVYAISLASISVAASILLMPPLNYSFYLFPFDLIMFIMWIVCFALLEELSGTHTCSSTWYETYWSTYWTVNNSDGTTTVVVSGAPCARWKTILAFSFILGFVFLISAVLGIYVCATYHEMGSGMVRVVDKCTPWKKKSRQSQLDIEKEAHAAEARRGLPDVAAGTTRNGV